jgi:hypothetical protein
MTYFPCFNRLKVNIHISVELGRLATEAGIQFPQKPESDPSYPNDTRLHVQGLNLSDKNDIDALIQELVRRSS